MATQITNYQCPACTGPLHFVGESGRLECDYCGSSFDIAEIEAFYAEKEAKAAEAAEAAQVAHIGLYRIGGQPPFRLDVCSVFAGIDFPLLLCPCHPAYSCRSGTLRREWLFGRMRYWRKMVIFGAKLRTVSDFMILHAVWIMSS